jgi:hypothetical protein
MDSLLIDLSEINNLHHQIKTCLITNDDLKYFIENNDIELFDQKVLKEYINKTYDYPDYIKQYFYDELDIKIFIGLIYRINSLKNLQNLQNYSQNDAIQFKTLLSCNKAYHINQAILKYILDVNKLVKDERIEDVYVPRPNYTDFIESLTANNF